MKDNKTPPDRFENDDTLFTSFLTEKYGKIAEPFVKWRRSLEENQRAIISPRVVQTMVIAFRNTVSLDLTSQLLPASFDKNAFINFINSNLSLNLDQTNNLEQLPNKSFSMDDEHVKKFILHKYGAVAQPFISWREGLSEDNKNLINGRTIQNMIHLYRGNIPLKQISGLLPSTINTKQFCESIEKDMNLIKKTLFSKDKVSGMREQNDQDNNKSHKIG